MTDPRVSKLADILVNYSCKVEKGDWVLILANPVAEPLVDELVAHSLRAGGNPSVMLGSDRTSATFLREANNEQLEWISPFTEWVYTKTDVLISLTSSTNTKALSNIDTEKQAKRHKAMSPIIQKYMERAASKELKWVISQYPTEALAQEAAMGITEFEDFVYQATFADKDDPVKEWMRVHKEQQRLVDWLEGKKKVEVKGKYADVSLSIDGRKFINSSGENNMPSGEIFTSPVEDSANGWVEFTYPAITGGREVEGIRLEFNDGKVVKESAEKNEDYLKKQLDMDEGARVLGEFAIGTNYGIDRFTKSILYDEKIGGSFHMAIGNGFAEIGGKNKSAVHWDMICDAREDTEILVDGELFYKDGKFQV